MVKLTAVSRRYPGVDPITAVEEVNLSVDLGEYVAVVGPSGSGKSTLLNIMGLLDRPSDGRVAIGGVDVTDAPERRRCRLRSSAIGFVFQSFHLISHRTARENVALGLLYRDAFSMRQRLHQSDNALNKVGLGGRLDALPGQLSGGEQQRVAIARALVGSPSLLLCDEPTGNLDAESTADLLDLLEGIRRSGGVTIVVATHDPMVSDRADWVVTMKDGACRQA